ncbi:class I SAM-dependent methyltransferase [Immundisolibacter sp.]
MSNDPSKELFDHYARHYESMGEVERLPDDLQRLWRDRLPAWIESIPRHARILDAGCAQGDLLAALSRVGYTNLTGVDISAQLLATAQNKVPVDVRLIEMDVRRFLAECAESAFDVVFFHDVLEHLPRQDTIGVLRAFHRALARGGLLSVRVPNMSALTAWYNAAIDFTHVVHFTENSLIQVFDSAGFDPATITFQSQAPRLFWSWHKPHRAIFRLLNRLRWHVNNGLHRTVFLLSDMHPKPRVFDPNLIMLARK